MLFFVERLHYFFLVDRLRDFLFVERLCVKGLHDICVKSFF